MPPPKPFGIVIGDCLPPCPDLLLPCRLNPLGGQVELVNNFGATQDQHQERGIYPPRDIAHRINQQREETQHDEVNHHSGMDVDQPRQTHRQ